MTYEFILPDLGEGLEEAEVVTWIAEVGQNVRADEPFVEVQTDKVTIEIPSPVAGTLIRQHYAAGEIVPVGAVLASFDADDGSTTPAVRSDSSERSNGPAPVLAAEPEPVPAHGARAKAGPAVRRRARQLGVSLDSVGGSGPGGRVSMKDLEAAARLIAPLDSSPQHQAVRADLAVHGDRPTPPTDERIPLNGVRRRGAVALSESWSAIPHMSSMDELDATNLLEAQQRFRAALPHMPITLLSFFVFAVARALRRNPFINASLDWDAQEIVLHGRCNVGFAAATPNGLVVPVVEDADQLGFAALSNEIARLTEAARTGSLTARDVAGATFTVTNFGSLGGSRFAAPLIRAPQVAIMGFGTLKPRPWVVDDAVVPRPVLPYSFSADHRVIDGATASAFTRFVVSRLSDPLLLALEA